MAVSALLFVALCLLLNGAISKSWALDERDVFFHVEAPSPTKRSSSDDSPDGASQLLVTMFSRDEHLTKLILVRNTRVPAEIPVSFDLEELNERSLPKIENVWHYQDPSKAAAMTVTRGTHGLRFQGHLEHDGEEYEVYPNEPNDVVVGEAGEASTAYVPHTMQKMADQSEFSDIDEVPDYIHFDKERSKRGRREWNSDFEVEVMFYVDHTIYDHWLAMEGDHDSAVNHIRTMYGAVFNAMDLSFKLIELDEYDIHIAVIPWEIKIFTRKENCPWTYGNIIGHLDNYRDARDTVVDENKALYSLPADLYKLRQQYTAGPDHLMLWTRYNIGRSLTDYTNIGLAVPCGVCVTDDHNKQEHGVSLVEDVGYLSWRTATHELGHSLGSQHDQDATCGYDYMMSPHTGFGPDRNKNIRFSYCSIDEMQICLQGYNGEMKGCLWKSDCSRRVEISQPSSLPGESLSLDDMCEFYVKPGSTHCKDKGEDVCSRLYCTMPDGCREPFLGMVADGTSCAKDKWCIKGFCEHKDEYIDHDINGGPCGVSGRQNECEDRWEGCGDTDAQYCRDNDQIRYYQCCQTCSTLLNQ